MKITILTTQLGGTGGALNCIKVCNKLIAEGHKIEVFSEMMPDPTINGLLKASVTSIKSVPSNLKQDLVLVFNITEATKKVFYELGGRKIFRCGLIHPEYESVLRDKEVTKISTTSNGKRIIDFFDRTENSVVILGPIDEVNFYPEYLTRNNVVMTYPKKSGWAGVKAINIAQKCKSNIVLGALGEDGIDSLPIKSETPITILGAPAHLRSHIRYCYNKVNMFVDTHSNGWWGWNCTVSEAMLCKCPVVATNSPENSDLILDGETALGFKHDAAPELPGQTWMTRPDPEGIAGGILRLYEDVGLREKLTTNAYKLVSQYNIDYWYKEFMRLT